MAKLTYRLIPQGEVDGKLVPLHIAFITLEDIHKAGCTLEQALDLVASHVPGPVGINVFDLSGVTTTSDGIMVDGAIVCMAAADHGKINREFGVLHMAEIPYSNQLVEEEPHLRQWQAGFSGRRLYRGPDPKEKLIPVHNVVITGRAANNNSATEMMNIVTMEEILLPILGQVQCVTGGEILLGYTGEVISVGIGMTVAERYGRVFPSRQFKAGETAHNSGAYAKTLKKHIPCIVAAKAVLARYTAAALACGCVPGRHIGCSPMVLSVAKHLGYPIDFARITPAAWEELESVGITRALLEKETPVLSLEELVAQADGLLPGVEQAKAMRAGELVQIREVG